MVKMLVAYKADVNAKTKQRGYNALHYAVKLKRRDLIKVLLQAGANALAKSTDDFKTPYEMALDVAQEEPRIAEDIKKVLGTATIFDSN